MPQTPLTYWKLGIVGVAEIGIIAAMLLGKIDVTPAVALMTTVATGLVLALGLASAGQQTAMAIQAHTRAMVSGLDAGDQRRPVPAASRGFAQMRLLVGLSGASFAALGFLLLLACTKAQGTEVETVGENIATCALNTAAADVEKGITDQGQIATDVIHACLGDNATAQQKTAVLAILEGGNRLRLAKAPVK